MADYTIKRTGRLARMLLSYIVGRLADDPDPSRTSGTGPSIRLVHDALREEVGIKDKRTWLKHLRQFESDRLVHICYGKNQYAPTVVRPGKMLWHCKDDEMLWQKYGGCIASRPHLPSDVHAMAQRSKTDVSKRSCYGISAGRTSVCRQKMKRMRRSDAMACSVKNAIAPDRNAIAKTQNAIAKSRDAVAFSPETMMLWQKTDGFCYGTTVSHTWQPDGGFELCFYNYLIVSDLQNPDNYRYIINTKYSKNKKSLNLKVGSVLSFTDSGENSEKGTHTLSCDTKTERGRRKEKAGGSRRERKTEAAVPQPVDQTLCKPIKSAPHIALDVREDGNVWLQWVRTTANRMSLDETAFSAFSDKWLARARLNGKLVKYQSHSIKDFIIQDFMKEQTDKCNEAVMAAAIQSSIPTAAAPVAQPTATQQTQGLRIPRGVTLCNRWGRLQEKQLELRGIAENYAYYITKILRGRGHEVGLGTLMELHDIFRLNIPGYAARYQGIGHDDARGYKAAEQWIFELARCGYSPANILQQAGF